MSSRREKIGRNIQNWRRNVSPYKVIEEACVGALSGPKGGFDHIVRLWILWLIKMLV